MFLPDGPTVVSAMPTPSAPSTPGYFSNGNPATGTPATILNADFMNMLAAELNNIVVAGGLTPSKTTYNQVLTSIESLIAASVSFPQSLSNSGYIKLPGGLIIQWTTANNIAFADIDLVFPIAFPNNLFNVVGTCGVGYGSAPVVVGMGQHTLTTQKFGTWYSSTAERIDASVFFIAIGN